MSGYDNHKAFSYGVVATAPSPATSGTSITLQTGQGALMPIPPFNATAKPFGALPVSTNAEIVRVTAISGDTLTIARAQEGSTAMSIAVGWEFAATITPKTLTDVENVIAPVFNVLAYGAKGDGTTDDTSAIQSAINACNTAGGGVVFFPAVTYIISSPLTIKNNVSLESANRAATIFLKAASNSAVITNGNAALSNAAIRRLTLDGNGANQTGNASTGQAMVYIGGTGTTVLQNIIIEDNTIQNSYKHMLFVTGDNNSNREKVIRNNYLYNHGSVSVIGFGIYTDYAPGTLIFGNTIEQSNGNDAIEMGHLGAKCVSNDLIDGPIQFPFGSNSIIANNIVRANVIQNDANAANNVIITGNQVLNASPASGYAGISTYGTGSIISNNYVKTTGQSGVRIYNGSYATISDNFIHGTNPSTGGTNGVYADTSSNISVFGNEIQNFARAIELVLDNNLVSYNTVVNCTTGVDLVDSSTSGHTMVGNQIFYNNLTGATTPFNAHNQTGYNLVAPNGTKTGYGTASPNVNFDFAKGQLALNSGLTNNSTRPVVGNSRIQSEIAAYSNTAFTNDDGFLRLSAGGGTNAIQKTFVDLTGFSNVNDMFQNIVFGVGGAEKMRLNSTGLGIGTSSPAYPLDLSTNTARAAMMDKGGQLFNVKAYGAKGDTKVVSDGAITSSTATLTSSTANFTSADVGKQIMVMGAGSAAANLNTTISAYISATQVTLAANASTTVSGASVTYGTDDTTAVTNAITALNAAASQSICTLLLPQGGNYMLTPQIQISANTHVINQGTITINPNYTVSGTSFLGLFQIGDSSGTNIIDNVEIEGGLVVGDCCTPLYTTNSPTFNPNNHKYICYIHSVSTHRNCKFHDYKVSNIGSAITLEKLGGVSGTPSRNVHIYNLDQKGVWVGPQYYCNGYLYEHCTIHDITGQFCYDDFVAVVGSNGGTAGTGTVQKIQVYNIRGEKSGQTGAFVKLDATNGIMSDVEVSNLNGYTSGVNEYLIGMIGHTSASNKKFNFWGLQSQGTWNYGLYGQTVGRHINLSNFSLEALFDIHFQGNAAPNANQSIRISNGLCMSRNASSADTIEVHGIGFSAGTTSQGFQNVYISNVDCYDKGKPTNEYTARTLTDGSMSSTTNTNQLSSATASFSAADVGYQITVVGAGASSGNLTGTITSVINSTTVVLSANCQTTVSGASFTITYIPGGTGTNALLQDFIYDVDIRNSSTSACYFTSTPRVVRFRQNGAYLSDSQIIANAFQLPTSPTNGYILTSDASGNATWQPNVAASDATKGYAIAMGIALG